MEKSIMVEENIIKCRKNGCNESDDNKLHLHHLVPKFMGGTDKDGRRRLCKKHHDILQLTIPSIIFKFVPIEREDDCRKAVKEFSLKWLMK